MVLFGVVDFHAVFARGADVPDIILVAVQELVEGLGLGKLPHLHFDVALTKFAPHGVEHHLGQGATSRIVLHLVVIQVDAFPSRVVVEVLGLAFLGPTAGWPPAGLFFDLQPSIDVLGEEPLVGFGENATLRGFSAPRSLALWLCAVRWCTRYLSAPAVGLV